MIYVLETAVRLLKSKLSRPAYKAYVENDELQQLLFADCIREAKAQIKMCGVRCDG